MVEIWLSAVSCQVSAKGNRFVKSCFSLCHSSSHGRILKNTLIPDTRYLTPNPYLRSMGESSLGDALKRFLKQSKLRPSIQALQIEDVWEQLMGKTIARYTEKIQIHGSTLYISTTVAPLRQELVYQRDKIIERVNEALGESVIKEVVIK
jgi:predicted nucleic acid-binding Zn ribbon protein